jgi:hypothetical protein
LNHPNIVQCYDVGSDLGLQYYSMEFIENGSVQDLVRKSGRIEPELALTIILDAARGLEYAEKRNLVHRDIKPDNLMINSEGVVKIADLGLAKETDRPHSIEDEGIFGTPHFISPEQARGERVDTRSDIYSLGASFYYMLCGETPFDAENVREIVRMQIEEEPPPLREKHRAVPGSISNLVTQMMAKEPEKRPATAAILLAQLESLSQSIEKRSQRLLKIGAAALAVVAVGIALFFILNKSDPVTPKGTEPDTPTPVAGNNNPRALQIEQRENDALRSFQEVQLQEVGLISASRTPEALRALMVKCEEVFEAFGETDSLPTTSGANNARALYDALESEAKEKEAAIAQLAEEARIKDALAKASADSISKSAKAHGESEQWALAIDVLRRGLRQPEIAGTTYLTNLSKEIEGIIKAATDKAQDDLALAEKDLSEQRPGEAITRLRARIANLREGFDPQTAPGEIFAAAKRLEDRITAIEKDLAEQRRANYAHDQEAGSKARRDLLNRIRSGLNTEALRTQAIETQKAMKTEPWQTVLAQDLGDIEAIARMKAEFLKQIAGNPPDSRKDKVLVPGASEAEKETSWDLVAVNDEGVHLERARGRFKRVVTWDEWSPADFYRRVISQRPPT